MRFSLQDVRKSISRRSGELSASLHFLKTGESQNEIEHLIAYHERLLGQPQRQFSQDDARSCIGDYRLAHCLIATLSNWYSWRQRAWSEVLQEISGGLELVALASPVQLRLVLYDYVNEHHQGFLDEQTRAEALQALASSYQVSAADLEYLLILDSEDEALLTREVAQPPEAREVALLYNQWVFEAALFNASSVHFVLDCNVFASTLMDNSLAVPTVGTGVGAAIKRLCFLARRLGVYYDLAYEATLTQQYTTPALLHLTLYGPQDVTGAPQQYGLRLARLCRMLLGYSNPKFERAKKGQKASISSALIEAEATVHFLQRSYNFAMDARLLHLLPISQETQATEQSNGHASSPLFDSSIEQSFSEAYEAMASQQGVDGWRLEREPEPLLLDSGIFIPDFAFTRGSHRIYVEILGFWTPSYRERKIQKLQQLQGRTDLLLAIPLEAKDAFSSIAAYFPIVFYAGQLSVTEVLQVLRGRYDDFAERQALIDVDEVRVRVRSEGLLPEQLCYTLLHCYRRSEIPLAAERIVNEDIRFVAGIGLYEVVWMERLRRSFATWMRTVRSATLGDALREMQRCEIILTKCDDATLESLISLWSEVTIRRASIFEAVVEAVDVEDTTSIEEVLQETSSDNETEEEVKKPKRERRSTPKKRVVKERETVQGDLWE